MALNKPRTQFGLSAMTAVSRTNGLPYGMIKVIKSMSSAFDRPSVKLYGGSNPNPFDAEYGEINMTMSLNFSEFKPFLFKLAYGDDAATYTAGAADGVVRSLTGSSNVLTPIYPATGNTVTSVITGISPTSAAAGASLKDGTYIIKAIGTATVSIYNVTDIRSQVGTDVSYLDDSLVITGIGDSSGVLTLTGNMSIAALGLTLANTATGLTAGHTAAFEVRGSNAGSGSFTYTIGENPVPVEFGAYFYSQVKANGEYFMEYFPRVKFSSFPKGMTAKAWSEATISAEILYDTALGYAAKTIDFGKEAMSSTASINLPTVV